MNKVLEGFKFGFGIILCLCLFFGIVFAIGFHSAEEILGGNFTGDFIFENNVTFNGNVNGISSGGFSNITVHTTPSTFNWTIPEGITKIKITAAGAGGSAGGSAGSSWTSASGGNTLITGNGINIQATGGLGGVSSASPNNSAGDGKEHQGGSGGNVIPGAGGTGGTTNAPGQGNGGSGSNGGLVTGIYSVTANSNITITIGAGGIATRESSYSRGGNGANGYVIIEY